MAKTMTVASLKFSRNQNLQIAQCSQISLLIVVTFLIHITTTKTILYGSIFDGTEDNEYENSILSCSPIFDCTINCLGFESCRNTTVLCPISMVDVMYHDICIICIIHVFDYNEPTR